MIEAVGTVQISPMEGGVIGHIMPVAAGAVAASPLALRSPFGLSRGIVVTMAASLAVLGGVTPSLVSGAPEVVRASVLSRVAPGLAASDLRVDPAAEDIVARHESLVRAVITLLKAEAARHEIVSLDFDVSRFEDPEEGDSQLVITQKVEVAADQALAYWDTLGRSIQAWAANLREEDARFLLERVAVNVDWNDGDSTVRPG